MMENEYAARTPTVGQLTAEAHEAFVRGDLVRVRDCLTAALELSPGNGELAPTNWFSKGWFVCVTKVMS